MVIFNMAWGGSLNENGSNHIRMLRQAEKIIEFLEILKDDLDFEERANLSKTIEIITDYVLKISDKKK